jgi:hypothetical protein
MSVRNTLYRQYMTIVAHWPVDPLRPNISFAETLHRRVQKYFGNHADADSSLPTQNTGAVPPDAGKQALKFDAKHIQNEINILGNLLEDRFKKTVSAPPPPPRMAGKVRADEAICSILLEIICYTQRETRTITTS